MMEEARAFLERGTAVLAERIQLSVLPPVLAFPGFEVAARMQPGEVVGGDYYNVRATSDGIWLAIGDVSGQGVTAGLITLLTHGILTGLGMRSADTSPAPIVRTLNELLVEHLARVGVSEHMTFSLLKLRNDGRLVWAGAHEDLLVLRARTGRCERLRTVGTWLGVVHHASEYMVDAEAALEPGDLLCAPTSHRLPSVSRESAPRTTRSTGWALAKHARRRGNLCRCAPTPSSHCRLSRDGAGLFGTHAFAVC